MTIAAIFDVLGVGNALYAVETPSELAALTREGIPASVVPALAEDLGMDRGVLAKTVGVAERTLVRRLGARARLSKDESDRVVRFARVVAQAGETLGDKAKAAHWLQSPNRALSGRKPLELLDTDAGVREVEAVLGRINYGVYS